MSSLLRKCAWVTLGIGLLLQGAANAQSNFPTKQVRVIVSFPPGGSADLTARIFAEKLGERWKQPMVVENINGAGGIVGAQAVHRAPADGYTLLLLSNTHGINHVLFSKIPFDITTDFVPAAMVSSSSIVIAANQQSKIINLKGLMDRMAKTKGEMNYLTCGAGTIHHFAMELFKEAVKLGATHIPEKGCGPAVIDAVGGQADVVVTSLPSILSFVKDGRLIPLAVTSKARSGSAKNVPTLAESGIPGLKDYAVENYYGFAAPAGTPKDVIAKIESDSAAVLAETDLKAKFANAGLDIFYLRSTEASDLFREDVQRYRKVAQKLGLHSE
ncbi:MAG: tripartite tricarboxylate transporter substrate binding protein [Bradyrhizobium sp.]|nr:tripartite tricarboxylate transporter substrate binding protein [Bradyrhizobium sp.]